MFFTDFDRFWIIIKNNDFSVKIVLNMFWPKNEDLLQNAFFTSHGNTKDTPPSHRFPQNRWGVSLDI